MLEFVAFGQRLGRSHARAVAAAEAALSKLRSAVVDAAPAASLNTAQLAALSAVGLMAQHEADTGAGEVTHTCHWLAVIYHYTEQVVQVLIVGRDYGSPIRYIADAGHW